MYLIEIETDGFKGKVCAKGNVRIPIVLEYIKNMLIDQDILHADNIDCYVLNKAASGAIVSDYKEDLDFGLDFKIWLKNGDKFFVMVYVTEIKVLNK